jgi:hypothetical protein
MENKPMPLSEFRKKLLELATKGQWVMFRAMVKKRKEYFEKSGQEKMF